MTLDDLKATAALAHLNMDEAELAASFPAFEEMLGFFAAMQAADGDQAAFSQGTPRPGETVAASFFRDDAPALSGEPLASKLLDKPGERDGRFVVVPNVL